jgi:hypothetical protein
MKSPGITGAFFDLDLWFRRDPEVWGQTLNGRLQLPPPMD